LCTLAHAQDDFLYCTGGSTLNKLNNIVRKFDQKGFAKFPK
jgi:hypothetical protein